MSKREWLWLTAGYLVWRLLLLGLALAAPLLAVYQPSFPYAYQRLPFYDLPQFIYSWAGFDGLHYLTIADQGYVGTGLIQAFFPGYPFLLRAVDLVVNNGIISGLLISSLFSWLLWVTWYYFLRQNYNQRVAWIGLAVLFLFPTSFFLTAVYSESLFMTLILWALMFAQQRRWWLVAILAFLVSATRVVGVLLIPALALEVIRAGTITELMQRPKSWFARPRFKSTVIKPLFLISLGSLSLLAYMGWLWLEFKDPLYFFNVQSQFGAGRQSNLILYPQVVWRYIKILLTYQPHDWKYFAYIQEAVVGVAGLGILLASIKKVRLSLWLFSVLAFFLPTVTGTFSSMPRYVLVCLPIFIWLSLQLETKRWFLWLYLLGSTVLLMINTMLFIQGYWVA